MSTNAFDTNALSGLLDSVQAGSIPEPAMPATVEGRETVVAPEPLPEAAGSDCESEDAIPDRISPTSPTYSESRRGFAAEDFATPSLPADEAKPLTPANLAALPVAPPTLPPAPISSIAPATEAEVDAMLAAMQEVDDAAPSVAGTVLTDAASLISVVSTAPSTSPKKKQVPIRDTLLNFMTGRCEADVASDTKRCVSDVVLHLAAQLMVRVNQVRKIRARATVQTQDVTDAMALIMNGSLGVDCGESVLVVLERFSSVDKSATSLREHLGLGFPVKPFERLIRRLATPVRSSKSSGKGMQVAPGAPVALAAVCDFLATDLLATATAAPGFDGQVVMPADVMTGATASPTWVALAHKCKLSLTVEPVHSSLSAACVDRMTKLRVPGLKFSANGRKLVVAALDAELEALTDGAHTIREAEGADNRAAKPFKKVKGEQVLKKARATIYPADIRASAAIRGFVCNPDTPAFIKQATTAGCKLTPDGTLKHYASRSGHQVAKAVPPVLLEFLVSRFLDLIDAATIFRGDAVTMSKRHIEAALATDPTFSFVVAE